jgi:hypothetical protein
MGFWQRKRSGDGALRKVDAQFVAELEALGFFRLAPSVNAEAAKREILERGYSLAGEIGRAFGADGEELAEGGVRNFVGHVAPFLRREGVRIEAEYGRWKVPARPPSLPPELNPYPGPTLRLRLSREPGGELVELAEDCGPETYRLMLGPEEIVFKNGWAEATTQTVALLDRLLAAHRSAERAWVIYGGGNEGIVWFATDEQAALLDSALPEREKLSKVGS